MKRFLLSSSTLGSLIFLAIAPAQAADAVLEPAAAFAPSWSGFYIGVHAGGAFGNYEYTVDIDDPGFAYDVGDKRGIVGFHAGYDHQFSNRWVGGLEVDITNIESVIAPITGDDPLFWVDWQASVTGRLGYLVSPETLFYGRAGLSFLDVEAIEGFSDIAEETLTAGRIGFGAETFLTSNLTARVEANYLRALDDITTADGSSFDPHILMATAGLTWRFGADAGSSFGAAQAPQADWQGFSVGAYGGYGFGIMERDVDVALAAVGPFASDTPLAGVFVGYDFQVSDRIVLGVEAEAAWLRARFNDPAGNSAVTDPPTLFATVDAMFGVSARVGFTVSPSTLVYVKGGYAGLRTEAEEEFFALDGGGEEVLDGYQVGVGIESALTEQVSLRVEATYIEAVEGITVANTQPDQNTLTPHLLLGKAGLAWRW